VILSGTPVGLPAITSSGEAGGHENITTAKNENIVGLKDGVAVLVKDYKLVARVLYEMSRVEVIT